MTAHATTLDRDTDSMTMRNISLAWEYVRAIVNDPTIGETIPRGVTLALIPDDEADLAAHNIDLAIRSIRAGKDVYVRHVRLADLPPLGEAPEGAGFGPPPDMIP